jgi:hypothetical protein
MLRGSLPTGSWFGQYSSRQGFAPGRREHVSSVPGVASISWASNLPLFVDYVGDPAGIQRPESDMGNEDCNMGAGLHRGIGPTQVDPGHIKTSSNASQHTLPVQTPQHPYPTGFDCGRRHIPSALVASNTRPRRKRTPGSAEQKQTQQLRFGWVVTNKTFASRQPEIRMQRVWQESRRVPPSPGALAGRQRQGAEPGPLIYVRRLQNEAGRRILSGP